MGRNDQEKGRDNRMQISVTRRTALRTGSVALLGGFAGCLFSQGQQRGVESVTLRNNTNSAAEVTATFLDCKNPVPESDETTASVAAGEEERLGTVIRNSGSCEIEVAVQNGLTHTHEWTVDETELYVLIEPDALTFTREDE